MPDSHPRFVTPPRLVIFDMDGTLADSTGMVVDSLERVLSELSIPSPGADAIRERVGLSLEVFIEDLLPAQHRSQVLDVVERYRREHGSRDYRDATRLFPGVVETLTLLKERGALLAVATGKSRPGLLRHLEAFSLRPFFDALRTADTTLSKPHPLMLFELLEETGVDADDAVMVGDTTFDLQMAQNAGIPSIGVTFGSHGADLLTAFDPVALLDDLRQLPPVLGLA